MYEILSVEGQSLFITCKLECYNTAKDACVNIQLVPKETRATYKICVNEGFLMYSSMCVYVCLSTLCCFIWEYVPQTHMFGLSTDLRESAESPVCTNLHQ